MISEEEKKIVRNMVEESKKENNEVTENNQPNTITIHRPTGFHNVVYIK